MGVERRANRKFRYSRTELGNHYTGVEANNKRVSYNAYLLDFLKTSLRAEFMRLFYRFSYGLKAEALRSFAGRYVKGSCKVSLHQLRGVLAMSRSGGKYEKNVQVWLANRVLGWRFLRSSKKSLKIFFDCVKRFSYLGEPMRLKKTISFIRICKEKARRKQLEIRRLAFKKGVGLGKGKVVK